MGSWYYALRPPASALRVRAASSPTILRVGAGLPGGGPSGTGSCQRARGRSINQQLGDNPFTNCEPALQGRVQKVKCIGTPSSRSYKNLDVWNVAMELAVACCTLAQRLPATERFELSAQIGRAAVSVPCNIAEGHSTGTDGVLIRHLRISRGSVGELETHMELATRLGLLTSAEVRPVVDQLARTGQWSTACSDLSARNERRLFEHNAQQERAESALFGWSG